MRRVDGKVAFITGVARGQGRAHAIKLAEEGANIIGVDICAPVESAPYEMASREDLDETVRLVEEAGGKMVARVADVRDLAALTAAVDEGVEQFGRLDIILGNAGVCTYGAMSTMDEAQWQEMMDIDLTGVWKTVRAGVKHMIDGGNGGAIVLTSSTAGLRNLNQIGHYVAAKHGVTGLAKAFANELAPHNIRVNSIHPGTIDTDMGDQVLVTRARNLGTNDVEMARRQVIERLPIGRMGVPTDIAKGIVFLASDDAAFMTGAGLVIDGGITAQ